MKRLSYFLWAVIPLWVGCATAPIAPPAPLASTPAPATTFPSLIKVSSASFPSLADDGDRAALRQSAEASARYFNGLSPDQHFSLAGDTYTARDLAQSVESFIQLLEQNLSPKDLTEKLKEDYNVYQSAGSDGHGLVTFSAYYEPTISARLQRSRVYKYPLLSRPQDLVDVDLSLFNSSYQGARVVGRLQGRALLPYYTRADIDSKKVLGPQNLEVAWAKDPLDIFFLQVEGSGWLDLGGGRTVRIRYDGDNGRKFTSVGQYLIHSGHVKAKGFGHDQFKRYLTQHPEIRQDILNVDERYVFFRLDTSTAGAYAFGNINEPLTPNRSIATDPKIFPKGLLAWISVNTVGPGLVPAPNPGLNAGRGRDGRAQGPPLQQRFMLNQDEGGAIQGAGRVDFFAGHGAEAEKFATHLWHPGQLYFIVKKPVPAASLAPHP